MDSIDKVIASGKIAEPHYSIFQGGILQLDNIVFCILILVAIIFITLNIIKKNKKWVVFSSAFLLVLAAFLIATSIKDYNEEKIAYSKEVSIWQDLEAKNYIKSLETKTKEISYFKISTEQPPQSEFWYGNKSFINKDILLFSTITYDKDTTVSGWFLINEDLKPNETPYVEYVELEKDLGNLIDKGFYNGVVHLPSDYLHKKVQK